MRLAFITASIILSSTINAAPGEDRPADRAEIRAHIDRIFKGFINKDANDLRATHEENWLGYLEGSRTMIKGIDQYMKAIGPPRPGTPYGMSAYTMREFDIIFKDDAAFVCFVADIESKTPSGPQKNALRITDFYVKKNGHWIQAGSDTQAHPESIAERQQTARTLPEPARKQLLDAREAVWRAFFSNDRPALEKLIPEDTITIEAHGDNFGTRAAVLDGAARFAKSGGKLVSLEFPKTDIQVYGYTAIVYSTYRYELEVDGKRSPQAGRVTEVFVYRNGGWVNPGWHMDAAR